MPARHDLDTGRLEPGPLAGMQAVGDRRDRLAIARGPEAREELAAEPVVVIPVEGGQDPRGVLGHRRPGNFRVVVVGNEIGISLEAGARWVGRTGRVRAVPGPGRRRGTRSRGRRGAGRGSSRGTRTGRAPSGTSGPPVDRVGRASRPSRHAGGNPSSASPPPSRRRCRPRSRRSRGDSAGRSTSRAMHPGPSKTSSSRHITQGAVPIVLPWFRARTIVAHRLGSSALGVPTTRCTRSRTPSWASMPRRTSSRGGDRSRLRKSRLTSISLHPWVAAAVREAWTRCGSSRSPPDGRRTRYGSSRSPPDGRRTRCGSSPTRRRRRPPPRR